MYRFDLDENQLAGEIPASRGNLKNLRILWLGLNQLTGQIPSALSSLTNLEGIWLSGNQVTGLLPPWLGSLTMLGSLHLAENHFTGPIPSVLGRLSNLEELRLFGNQLSGEIPAELGGLSKLETLRFADNRLTGCVPSGLRYVADNDFDQLGLPFCDPTTGGPEKGGRKRAARKRAARKRAARKRRPGKGRPGKGRPGKGRCRQRRPHRGFRPRAVGRHTLSRRRDVAPDSDDGATAYEAAFPTADAESVCNSCNGYELVWSLDFDDAGSYDSGAVNNVPLSGIPGNRMLRVDQSSVKFLNVARGLWLMALPSHQCRLGPGTSP